MVDPNLIRRLLQVQLLSDALATTSRENAYTNKTDVSTYQASLYEGHYVVQLGGCLLRLWPLVEERLNNNLSKVPNSEKEQFLAKLRDQLMNLSGLLRNIGIDLNARYNQESANSMLAREESLQYYIKRILRQRADIYHILSEENPNYQEDEQKEYLLLGDIAYISQDNREHNEHLKFAIIYYEKAGASSEAQPLYVEGLSRMVTLLEGSDLHSPEVDYSLYRYADASVQAQFSERLLEVAREHELTDSLVSANIYASLGRWGDYRRLTEGGVDSSEN